MLDDSDMSDERAHTRAHRNIHTEKGTGEGGADGVGFIDSVVLMIDVPATCTATELSVWQMNVRLIGTIHRLIQRDSATVSNDCAHEWRVTAT